MTPIPITVQAGGGIVVSATGSSVGGTLALTSTHNAIYVCNTSATLYVAVRIGTGSQTASITTDTIIPPMSAVILAANSLITGCAAIGSAAGPTIVGFIPCTV